MEKDEILVDYALKSEIPIDAAFEYREEIEQTKSFLFFELAWGMKHLVREVIRSLTVWR